jgi:hypothetical protein
MMEAVRPSETSVDNHFTWQYNPEGSSEHLCPYSVEQRLQCGIVTTRHTDD